MFFPHNCNVGQNIGYQSDHIKPGGRLGPDKEDNLWLYDILLTTWH